MATTGISRCALSTGPAIIWSPSIMLFDRVVQAMKEQSTCAAAREQEVSMEESLWLQDRFEAILQRVAAAEEEAAWMREELSRQSGGSGLVRVIGALGNMLGHALFG